MSFFLGLGSRVSRTPEPASRKSLGLSFLNLVIYNSLRVHVTQDYIIGTQSLYIGGPLRPKCSLFRYMDPEDLLKNPFNNNLPREGQEKDSDLSQFAWFLSKP